LKKVLYQDGSRILYQTDNEEEVLVKFSDDIVDGKGNVKTSVKSKGALQADMAAHIFKLLASYHIPTVFKSAKSDKEILVKRANLLPLKVYVENQPAEQGMANPVLSYALLTDGREKKVEMPEVRSSGVVTGEQLGHIRRYAVKINVILRNFFTRRGLDLLGFWIQFGVLNGKVVICSEFSLDTCDLKELNSRTKFTSAYLSSHTENLDELFSQLCHKLMLS
jgi:phosphoribosylaminoimidazole-succinocarboxamide synthase